MNNSLALGWCIILDKHFLKILEILTLYCARVMRNMTNRTDLRLGGVVVS